VTQGARELFGNVDGPPAGSASWAMHHSELYTLIWVLVILAIFVPLATRQYKRAASR
jgi:hypothetical protein